MKWKIFLGALAVIMLSVGGWLYYELQIKEYSYDDDEEVVGIVDTDFELLLPNFDDEEEEEVESNQDNDSKDNEVDNSEVTVPVTANNPSSSNSNISTNTSSSSSSSSSSNQTSNNKAVSLERILGSYHQTFEQLEEQANERLNNLLKRAYDEFQEKKKNGESISYTQFFGKYSASAESLEARADASFYSVYTSLQNDLEKHGYSVEEANKFENDYENAKKERKNAVLNMVKERF
jgi:DNA anti-recombination protein RmuC